MKKYKVDGKSIKAKDMVDAVKKVKDAYSYEDFRNDLDKMGLKEHSSTLFAEGKRGKNNLQRVKEISGGWWKNVDVDKVYELVRKVKDSKSCKDGKELVGKKVKIVGNHNRAGKIGKVQNYDGTYYFIGFDNGNTAYVKEENIQVLDSCKDSLNVGDLVWNKMENYTGKIVKKNGNICSVEITACKPTADYSKGDIITEREYSLTKAKDSCKDSKYKIEFNGKTYTVKAKTMADAVKKVKDMMMTLVFNDLDKAKKFQEKYGGNIYREDGKWKIEVDSKKYLEWKFFDSKSCKDDSLTEANIYEALEQVYKSSELGTLSVGNIMTTVNRVTGKTPDRKLAEKVYNNIQNSIYDSKSCKDFPTFAKAKREVSTRYNFTYPFERFNSLVKLVKSKPTYETLNAFKDACSMFANDLDADVKTNVYDKDTGNQLKWAYSRVADLINDVLSYIKQNDIQLSNKDAYRDAERLQLKIANGYKNINIADSVKDIKDEKVKDYYLKDDPAYGIYGIEFIWIPYKHHKEPGIKYKGKIVKKYDLEDELWDKEYVKECKKLNKTPDEDEFLHGWMRKHEALLKRYIENAKAIDIKKTIQQDR